MRNYSLVPRPWWEVGLTVLPGLIVLLGSVSSSWPPFRFLMLAVLILLMRVGAFGNDYAQKF